MDYIITTEQLTKKYKNFTSVKDVYKRQVYITQISNGIVEGTFPANDEEVMLTPNSVTALGVQPVSYTHLTYIRGKFRG